MAGGNNFLNSFPVIYLEQELLKLGETIKNKSFPGFS
jgi:hypothetical protein